MTNIALKNNNVTKEIHNLVSSIGPHDELEQERIRDTISWIESGAPIFRIEKPDIPNKHLVSYFVLLDEENRKILLVDHKKARLWLPPGGHVEIDEDPKEAARRECHEELGVSAEFIFEEPIFLTSTLTANETKSHTDVSLWYLLGGDHLKNYVYDEGEFNQICWFDFDKIPFEKSDPHMRRFIEKLKVMMRI